MITSHLFPSAASAAASSSTAKSGSAVSASWARAVSAYSAAVLSGSDLGADAHALWAVKSVVSNISAMPTHSALRVLSSLGCLSEEAPMTAGPHAIEAAANFAVKLSSSAELDDWMKHSSSSASSSSPLSSSSSSSVVVLSSVLHEDQKRRSTLTRAVCATLSRHRIALMESDSRVAVQAVSNCMSEGRWATAISILAKLPELIQSKELMQQTQAAESQSGSRPQQQHRPRRPIHLAPFVEALNSALRNNQHKAVATLMQVLRQHEQHDRTQLQRQNSHDHHDHRRDRTSGVVHALNPHFILDGLHPDDLHKMMLTFRQADNGWRLASILFSSAAQSSPPSSGLLLNSGALNSSLAVFAHHGKWREAASLVKWRTSMRSSAFLRSSGGSDLVCNSVTVSTAVKIMRQSPWYVALDVVSRICAHANFGESSDSSKLDAQAASEIAGLVVQNCTAARWYHAAAALDLMQKHSAFGSSSGSSNQPSMMMMAKTPEQLVVEAYTVSRLTVKLASEGHHDLAAKALRYVRATGDQSALHASLNSLVASTLTVRQCDAWLMTMLEEGLQPSRAAREHLLRLHCDEGSWEQALLCARDLFLEQEGKETLSQLPILDDQQQQQQQQQQQNRPAARRAVSPRTHVKLQTALRSNSARWDVAVRAFVALESTSTELPLGNNQQSAVRQVAEAFRLVVSSCMEQQKDDVAQGLLQLMVQKGTGSAK